MIQCMSESSEYAADTTQVVTTPVVTTESKPNRLYQALAWVGIVAGTLFIVAVIFFSGFILGKSSGGYGHFGRHGGPGGHGMMMERYGPPHGPVMRPGGPGMWGPGAPGEGGPGQGGPAQPGPGQPPGR
jgi:hypothetical protein